MKVLELMNSLEEAYNRFGDVEIKINFDRRQTFTNTQGGKPIQVIDFDNILLKIKELIIESEEFIVRCE